VPPVWVGPADVGSGWRAVVRGLEKRTQDVGSAWRAVVRGLEKRTRDVEKPGA